MATYNFMTYFGSDETTGLNGRYYGYAGNVAYTSVAFLLDCEGANNTTYTTATAPPGAKDICATDTGTATNTGTWQLKTAQFNLGTSSMLVPQTSSYYRSTNTIAKYSDYGTLAFWVYFTSLPSTYIDFFGFTTGTTGFTGTPTYAEWLGFNSSGTIRISRYHNGVAESNLTTTAAVTSGGWRYISYTWHGNKAYVGIGGTVETLDRVPRPYLTLPAYYGTIQASTNTPASMYFDDIYAAKTFDPYKAANYSVPTSQIQNVSPITDRSPYTTTNAGFLYNTTPGNLLVSASTDADLPYSFSSMYYPSEPYHSYATNMGLQYIFGMTASGNSLIPGIGVGGTGRPTTGMLYPRGTLC